MKKQYMSLSILMLAAVWLTACAGNPPAWWNPSGMYGPTASEPSVSPKSTRPVIVPAQTEIPAEENIIPVEDNYEEEKLAPLPAANEEETPAASTDKEEAEELSLTRPSLLD